MERKRKLALITATIIAIAGTGYFINEVIRTSIKITPVVIVKK